MFGHAYNINNLSTLAKMNFLCFYQSLIVIDVTLTLFTIQLLLKEQTMVWYCQGGNYYYITFFLIFTLKTPLNRNTRLSLKSNASVCYLYSLCLFCMEYKLLQ